MDAAVIQGWLGLPPGPWPPDPRTLLGVPPDAPAAAVERAGLARMAALRPHQLVQPDLVTEGMNRIAQAMLALASSELRPISDLGSRISELKPKASTATTAPPAFDLSSEIRDPRSEIGRSSEIPAGIGREGRRLVYRELAGLRRVADAWDALAPVAGDPGAGVTAPAAYCAAWEAATAFRAALAHPGVDRAAVARLAPSLVAVFIRPDAVAVLRSLTRQQRGRVAAEWAAGKGKLAGWRKAVRNALRAARRGDTIGPRWRRTVAAVGGTPESLLVAVGLAGGLVAVARWVAR